MSYVYTKPYKVRITIRSTFVNLYDFQRISFRIFRPNNQYVKKYINFSTPDNLGNVQKLMLIFNGRKKFNTDFRPKMYWNGLKMFECRAF